MKKCIICDEELTGKQRQYCSNKCKAKSYNNCYASQKQRALKRKMQLIKLKGNKCEICGYNKNLAGMVFHHTEEKNMKLDSRSLANSKMSKILEEVKTCRLLCHNCHSELHYPHLTISN